MCTFNKVFLILLKVEDSLTSTSYQTSPEHLRVEPNLAGGDNKL